MNALLIARNTFREAIRDRALLGLVVAGLTLLALTQMLGMIAMGEGLRLTVDLGLSSISVLGLVAILLVGTSLVAKEIERRTIYNLLSRPIERSTYLMGKWLGLSGALAVLALVIGVALWGLLFVRGAGAHGPAIAQAVVLAVLELSVLTAVAVLFSALSTPVLSALYTLGLFMIGQWSGDLRGLATRLGGSPGAVLDTIANIVPNLPLFNMRALASAGETANPIHLVLALGYALLYCGCALALASAAFQTRDFK